MGWEKRGNNYYYYTKEWENGKCVSRYIGQGDLANLLCSSQGIRQSIAEGQRLTVKHERAPEIALDEALDELSEMNKSLVDALFLTNGFHRHKRQWRRKK